MRRLKGNPRFDDDAFEAVQGPAAACRAVSILCDRLLLFGFLGGKTSFTATDVNEVAREIYEETSAPPMLPAQVGAPRRQFPPTRRISATPTWTLTSRLELDVAAAEDAANRLAGLRRGHLNERIQRLERSLMRLERLNSATLTLLQQLVAGQKSNPGRKTK